LAGELQISWLRLVPRRITLTDGVGRRHQTPWLDPGQLERERLPTRTRSKLDDVEAGFKPTSWGRYSWRTLVAVMSAVAFAAVVIIGFGTYAMFPRRMIIALLVGVIGFLPFIMLILVVGGRLWVRRTGASARINACIASGNCPVCLRAIDTLTARPINLAACACGAQWPTLGALQAGGRPIAAAATVARTGELAWLIPLGLFSATLSFGMLLLPQRDQIIAVAAVVILACIFPPFITLGRPARAWRLALTLAGPAIAAAMWSVLRSGVVVVPLWVGGGLVGVLSYAVGRLGSAPRTIDRPGWDVAHFICDACGYDLRGTASAGTRPTICPECGHAVEHFGLLAANPVRVAESVPSSDYGAKHDRS
jgi:hypothetical protein